MKKEQVLDEWLLMEYQNGKKKSLELLTKRWYPKLSQQIYWHTRDKDAVRDIVQETWYAILKGIPKLKNKAHFGVWASKIAYYKSVDWIKENQKQRKSEVDLSQNRDLFNPENTNDEEEKIQQIRKVMATLPDAQRSVLAMFYLESYSVREIAKILDISPNTVKSRLFQAREKLKSTLKNLSHEKK